MKYFEMKYCQSINEMFININARNIMQYFDMKYCQLEV